MRVLLAGLVIFAGYAGLAYGVALYLFSLVPAATDPVEPQIHAMLVLLGVSVSALMFVPLGLALRRSKLSVRTSIFWPLGAFIVPPHIPIWPIAYIAYLALGLYLVLSARKVSKSPER